MKILPDRAQLLENALRQDPIAVVAADGLFPGANDLNSFWKILRDGVDTSREAPPNRWVLSHNKVVSDQPAVTDKVYTNRGCFLEPFDWVPENFDIPKDIQNELDLSVKILLETTRRTLTKIPWKDGDRSRTGVIVGNIALPTESSSCMGESVVKQLFSKERVSIRQAITKHSAWNRYVTGMPAAWVAQAFGFGGKAFTLDAACASSLYALKLACDELLSRRADVMITGGVSRPDSLYTQMGFSQLRALSPTGRCSPFDAKGNGLVVGEGAGIVIVKRLSDALQRGDPILATIRGFGLSNDLEGNLLSPNSEGQLRALKQAYRQAGWSPEQVDFIECHATGTPVGDAVEFESLCRLWEGREWGQARCALGAVKANVGHLLTGAGAASLVKLILALKHESIPPTANFDSPSERVALSNSPFRILRSAEPWLRRSADTPRRAAINGFGFGGINAHVLIEEWLPQFVQKNQGLLEITSNKTTPNPAPINQGTNHSKPRSVVPIAIVGVATKIGPWRNLAEFRERVLGGTDNTLPKHRNDWRGASLLNPDNESKHAATLPGYFLSDLEIPVNRYRIPPKELSELLPQQALMLECAREALNNAHWNPGDPSRNGVFIGLGLDLRTTDFHTRWQHLAAQDSDITASRFAGDSPPAQASPFPTNASKNHPPGQAQPPLTADRTMGALAGVNACRIAKEFQFGGPSHTVCAEDGSGDKALEIALDALSSKELDQALVGAVEIGSDPRAVLATHQLRRFAASLEDLDSVFVGEGAVALVLKRLEDAERDGDRIYATFKGNGSCFASPLKLSPISNAILEAANRASSSSNVQLSDLGYIDFSDPQLITNVATSKESPRQEMPLDSSAARLRFAGSTALETGHTGAASGLAAVLRASLALYHQVIPPSRGGNSFKSSARTFFNLRLVHNPQHWLRNRVSGARKAGVVSCGIEGNVTCWFLEEHIPATTVPADPERFWVPRLVPDQVFLVQGETREILKEEIILLREKLDADVGSELSHIARLWYDRSHDQLLGFRLSIVIQDADQLRRLLHHSLEALLTDQDPGSFEPQSLHPTDRDRLFFSTSPPGLAGDIAFVYPGSGSYFADMGRELAVRWPEILRRHDQENDSLANQFAVDRFWNNSEIGPLYRDHRYVICGQVSLGTMTTDLMRFFGVEPNAAIGYSLGESTALFALRAWTERDEMYRRVMSSSLFGSDLTGTPEVLRATWQLSVSSNPTWIAGLAGAPPDLIRKHLSRFPHSYLLIINSESECIVGGESTEIAELIQELGCRWIPIEGISTVHCAMLKPFEDAYRNLHSFKTLTPSGIRFYSGGWGHEFFPDNSNATESIVAQASNTVDFARVVRTAYDSGIRIFIEMGPGNSCTRMIREVLKNEDSLIRSICASPDDSIVQLLKTLAALLAYGVRVDLRKLFTRAHVHSGITAGMEDSPAPSVRIAIQGGTWAPVAQVDQPPLTPPEPPPNKAHTSPSIKPGLRETADSTEHKTGIPQNWDHEMDSDFDVAFARALLETQASIAAAHESFLEFSARCQQIQAITIRDQLLGDSTEKSNLVETSNSPGTECLNPVINKVTHSNLESSDNSAALNRSQCLEFAIGSVANVLGSEFTEADSFPTRVRLPDEPLMLVDRILSINAIPKSMTHGNVVTEHDVLPNAWYLDCNCIPTCIAVEAGQADLFLSGYLGIDFITRGLSMYRLLDAKVCFHRSLPGVGSTIRYDIHIDSFFRQGNTWLFRFRFEATVNGEALLSMSQGCAGFFSHQELEAGRGIVKTRMDLRPMQGKFPASWQPYIPMTVECYSEAQLDALRAGRFDVCFGPAFASLRIDHPLSLPSGRMRLVHRIPQLDPKGGRYGIGLILGEADIHPDDWFITCHFVDDRVMPGTLMFECCLHTLRVFLLRMGWIVPESVTALEPIPGVSSQLKCRGQVLESTQTVTYEVTLKEVGFGPEPFVIADALMYADGKPIVEIGNMSLRYRGVSREILDAIWNTSTPTPIPPKQVLYNTQQILAFAIGKPSEAFGKPYEIFDSSRRIARLPGPPYCFLDRIVHVEGEPFKLTPGGAAIAEYDVPEGEWYFETNHQREMAFAVLLEIALQPCGWLAAYVGSALTSDEDLSFRNLGGTATQFLPIQRNSGTLSIHVKMPRVSSSAGMIIQWYDFEVFQGQQLVYKGDTYFGFFPKSALAKQEGIQNARRYTPTAEELIAPGVQSDFDYPQSAPFPDSRFSMIDHVELLLPHGGPARLGFIRASKKVDPEDWFFKAHFYQDPVVPGSLGLESFLQLLKLFAASRWGSDPLTQWQAVAINTPHEWIYRGQVIPSNKLVTVEAMITEIDDQTKSLTADGYLSVDGRVIYGMKHFVISQHPPSNQAAGQRNSP